MVRIGYTLSSEEHGPGDLLLSDGSPRSRFRLLTIADRCHPWTSRQGQSPFVRSVLGGLAVKTEEVDIVTAVTCPTIRIHPAIVAQAAATTAAMLPDRFVPGVGSGENLNEHVLGDPWPHPEERLQMLEEAIGLMRALWNGKLVTEWTDHYTVDRAQLYTLPETSPPIARSILASCREVRRAGRRRARSPRRLIPSSSGRSARRAAKDGTSTGSSPSP